DSDTPLPESQSATSDVLWAAAKVIGSECVDQNLAFLRCKKGSAEPSACLVPGKEVTSCVSNV
ncbi:unnamed protein product, partial [Choristocarpus tenellus]